ncbi:hypothetical protein E4U53_006977 [Claviceps sorghi]|nr:hypothetical protein E4U53_006977 [Claviceps sorghi]
MEELARSTEARKRSCPGLNSGVFDRLANPESRGSNYLALTLPAMRSLAPLAAGMPFFKVFASRETSFIEAKNQAPEQAS